jgi:hypothetical protein
MNHDKWTQTDARAAAAETLRLSLHGPSGDGLTPWPGFNGEPRLVGEGSPIPADYKFDLPMHDGAGNEVIFLTPTAVYGIGVLYPVLNDAQHAQLTAEQRQPQVSDEGDEFALELNEVVDLEVDPDSDLSPDASEEAEESKDTQARRPQSMAFSVHVPKNGQPLRLAVRGATYAKMSILHGTTTRQVWRRKFFEASIEVPVLKSQTINLEPSDCSRPENWPEHLKLSVGITVHSETARGVLCTIYVLNQTEVFEDVSSSCVFQSELEAVFKELLPYPSQAVIDDETEASFELLYRNNEIMAVGHGCDANVSKTADGWSVKSDVLPILEVRPSDPDILDEIGQPYSVGMLDIGLNLDDAKRDVQRIIDDYGHWIERERERALSLERPESETASSHLDAADRFLQDIKTGWKLFQENPEVNRILRWTSLAMNAQRISSSLSTRPAGEDGSFSTSNQQPDLIPTKPNFRKDEFEGFGKSEPEKQGRWRPFQIAFVLSSLEGVIDGEASAREEVDVIWMPTGGGKTEAYLGLAAFTILWTRRQSTLGLVQHTKKFFTSVLMRYTYRLLTTQQVLRAASLICALEIIRKTHLDLLDPSDCSPIRIGAWLGGKTTPNSREAAVRQWDNIAHERNRFGGKFLLTRCPWCAAEMGRGLGGKVVGYQKVQIAGRTELFIKPVCPDERCPFAGGAFPRLPVLEVDEDIYEAPPAFVVGTVDKFARLVWESRASRLFGLSQDKGIAQRVSPPPALLIQDELHLISGPLGSMNAMFEFVIEELCTAEGGAKPKIVGATATTRNFESQSRNLYGRGASRLLPPPGIDIADSFFARTATNPASSKFYVGICAPGLGSVVEAQLRVIASLSHAGASLEHTPTPNPDPWWTNLVFFSSRRSLALQKAACQTELRNRMWTLAQRSGVRTGDIISESTQDSVASEIAKRRSVRNIRQIRELTATSTDNIGELLEDLNARRDADNAVDICFATSMIEVGVDVPRLGLMTVMGQPKSASQYIQVTGRVGRNLDAPGLVVVVLSPHSVRDRSHFESFRSNHERLYSSVESVSVTPFTPQALERTCAGALKALYSALLPSLNPMQAWESSLGTELRTKMEARARFVTANNPSAMARLNEEFNQLEGAVRANAQKASNWDDLMVMAGSIEETRTEFEVWIAPNSMRHVEPESGLRIMATDISSRSSSSAKSFDANSMEEGSLE